MARRDPTAVWLRRRKGTQGVTYGLRWIDPLTGRGRSESCGRHIAYARRRRQQVRQELRDGLSGSMPEVRLADFIDNRLPALMAGKSPVTVRKTQESLRALDRLNRTSCLTNITRAVVMEFRSSRLNEGLSPATVNKDLRQIKSALSYAVDAGLLRANPLLRWKGLMLREPEKQVRVVEQAEFRKLLQACKGLSFRALLVVAYHQGLRRGELVQLRWSAVDLEAKVLHVVNVSENGEFTKSRKNRAIPMHPEVERSLSTLWEQVPKAIADGRVGAKWPHVFTWPDGTPLLADWVTHEFARVVQRARVSHCTLHDLRRSFSTLAQRAGIDREMVKDLGGWSVVSVVERHYTGDISGAYRRAIDRIAETA